LSVGETDGRTDLVIELQHVKHFKASEWCSSRVEDSLL